MKSQRIIIVIAESLGLTLKTSKVGKYKLKACPKCKETKNLTVKDCGYSSFNPGWVECKCGYKFEAGYVNEESDVVPLWNKHFNELIPDYPNDLNACRTVRAAMTHEQKKKFCEILPQVIKSENRWIWDIVDMTAEQFCEIYIRSIGKWEE